MTEVLIIGGGLSGLFAACLSAQAGLRTALVMRGRGGLSLSHGALELFDRASPSRTISNLKAPHPYALAGKQSLIDGLNFFSKITGTNGLYYEGGRSSNRKLITASGSTRSAAYMPAGYSAIEPDRSAQVPALGYFDALRDFQAHLAADNYSSNLTDKPKTIKLPLIHAFTNRELYPIDIARMFDDLDWAAENARAWKPHLVGVQRLGLPALLGLDHHDAVVNLLQESLGLAIFEIPTLPPSVPGLRLERLLRRFAESNGTRIIEGPTARGRVQQKNGRAEAAGVVLDVAGRQSVLDSRCTILATGSILHGGLVATQDHRLYEATFNLPVEFWGDRGDWVQGSLFDDQPYSKFGISVNSDMQALDIYGEVMLENLYAIGGILKGADRTKEGSRQGIDIATAYRAVDHIKRSIT